MKRLLRCALGALFLCAAGCDYSVKSARSFRIPQGDVEKGKAAFVALKCVECHTVSGVADLARPTAGPEKVVVLGGDVTRLRTVGDLLTSITHPNFALSEKWKLPAANRPAKSPMPALNDVMTVAQLIDLVTFLQPRYSQIPPPYDWNYSL